MTLIMSLIFVNCILKTDKRIFWLYKCLSFMALSVNACLFSKLAVNLIKFLCFSPPLFHFLPYLKSLLQTWSALVHFRDFRAAQRRGSSWGRRSRRGWNFSPDLKYFWAVVAAAAEIAEIADIAEITVALLVLLWIVFLGVQIFLFFFFTFVHSPERSRQWSRGKRTWREKR